MSGPAHPTHELQRGDVPYEAPFIRSASPNDSLTTAYGPDETNLSDLELSDDAFSKKVLAGLRVHEKREEEEYAETRPLLMPRPRRGAATNSCSTSGEERGGIMHQTFVTVMTNSIYMK
jgi:IS5 family transposase